LNKRKKKEIAPEPITGENYLRKGLPKWGYQLRPFWATRKECLQSGGRDKFLFDKSDFPGKKHGPARKSTKKKGNRREKGGEPEARGRGGVAICRLKSQTIPLGRERKRGKEEPCVRKRGEAGRKCHEQERGEKGKRVFYFHRRGCPDPRDIAVQMKKEKRT